MAKPRAPQAKNVATTTHMEAQVGAQDVRPLGQPNTCVELDHVLEESINHKFTSAQDSHIPQLLFSKSTDCSASTRPRHSGSPSIDCAATPTAAKPAPKESVGDNDVVSAAVRNPDNVAPTSGSTAPSFPSKTTASRGPPTNIGRKSSTHGDKWGTTHAPHFTADTATRRSRFSFETNVDPACPIRCSSTRHLFRDAR